MTLHSYRAIPDSPSGASGSVLFSPVNWIVVSPVSDNLTLYTGQSTPAIGLVPAGVINSDVRGS